MKRILLDASVHQTRIAVVEDGELRELIFDSKYDESIVGNIYCGRISNVLQGMQAVFVDIGEEKNAYLYHERANNSDNQSVSKPKVGQEVIVQVEKAPSGSKGAVVTTKISFPGKFVVLIPNDNNIGISKKIEDNDERIRIKQIAKKLLPENYGIIIRTNGTGKSSDDFENEISGLIKVADKVMKVSAYSKAPVLIHKESAPVIKASRDIFSDDVDEFIISGQEEYDTLKLYIENDKKILLYDLNVPIFENYFIESQVEKALNKKVWLKSGGFLIIEQTEACVVIDVNTGKYIGKKDFRTTVFKTNMEAAMEVAKQMRLRNLSGMIIVDFIDMKNEEDKIKLRHELEKAVSKDRIKTVVMGMTELGLMQITRKKTRPSITAQLTTSCRCCNGSGRVPTIDYVLGELRREVISIFVQTVFNKVIIFGDIRLLNTFAGVRNEYKEKIEKEYCKSIELVAVENRDFGYYKVERVKV